MARGSSEAQGCEVFPDDTRGDMFLASSPRNRRCVRAYSIALWHANNVNVVTGEKPLKMQEKICLV